MAREGTTSLVLPSPDAALARVLELGELVGDALKHALETQFACDDTLQQLINSKIGSPNEMTGKAHSYSSAETWAKNEEMWRDARREVIRCEAEVEDLKAQLARAKLVARMAVLADANQAAA